MIGGACGAGQKLFGGVASIQALLYCFLGQKDERVSVPGFQHSGALTSRKNAVAEKLVYQPERAMRFNLAERSQFPQLSIIRQENTVGAKIARLNEA